MQPPDPSPHGSAREQPSRVRWRILALLLAFSYLTWFNRVSMAVAYDERIKDEYGISEQDIGFVYSAFLLSYAICMTPGGWFIDRYGARTALAVVGFGSAVFGALTGAAGFVPMSGGLLVLTLLIIRPLMGVASAPIYPSTSRLVGYWLPLRQRSWANGLVSAAALVGIASTFVVFGGLIDAFGWQAAFLVSAAVTALVAVVWAVYARNVPEEHGGVNEAERHLIEGDESISEEHGGLGAKPAVAGWWSLVGHRGVLLLTLSYAAIGYFQYLFFFWMHYYFKDVLKLADDSSRLYAAIPNLAMAVGMVAGGWLSDRLLGTCGRRLGRALVAMAGMTAGALLLILGILAEKPGWIVFWFALALGAVGASEGPFWATAVELGRRRGGTAAGVMNTGGNVGGLAAPIVTPWVGNLLGWKWAIGLGSAICLLGVCLWCWIDPTRSADNEPAGAVPELR
jgi:MFS family permease